jgi:putative heme-binding domain-containing protein
MKNLPEGWRSIITTALCTSMDFEKVLPAAKALGADKWADDDLKKALAAIAKDDKQPDAVRLSALSVTPKAMDDALFAFTLVRLKATQPAAVRSLAAEVLSKAPLSAKQLAAIATAIPTASPLDFDKLLGLFAKSADEAVGLALVKALSEPKVRAAIRAEEVKPVLAKYPKTVQAEAEKLYKLLESDRAELTKKLDTVLKETKPGDVRRGQAVFNSAKAACTSCHKVAYVGGLIGPDLTKVGGVRSERDLLESIVFPSATFVRSYEPVRVETKDGKSFNGILKADRPDEVVLTVTATEEVRVARADIDELKPGTVSVMPAGLDQQLTPQELADLVAFLRSLK